MLARFVVAFVCLLQTLTVQAFFSINYVADESHPALMTPPGVFKEAPQAEHVADIYARLSGQPPLFWEGEMNIGGTDRTCVFQRSDLLVKKKTVVFQNSFC